MSGEKWNVRLSIERPDGSVVSSYVVGRIPRGRLAAGVGPAMGEFLRGAADLFESPGTAEHEAGVREHMAQHLADEACPVCHPETVVIP